VRVAQTCDARGCKDSSTADARKAKAARAGRASATSAELRDVGSYPRGPKPGGLVLQGTRWAPTWVPCSAYGPVAETREPVVDLDDRSSLAKRCTARDAEHIDPVHEES
jgi:hypothetical protein